MSGPPVDRMQKRCDSPPEIGARSTTCSDQPVAVEEAFLLEEAAAFNNGRLLARCTLPNPILYEGGGARGKPVSDSKPSRGAAPAASTAFTSAPPTSWDREASAAPPG